jgi:hypothetical protein
MLRGLVMTMTICLAGVMSTPTHAAAVVFTGTLDDGGVGSQTFSPANNAATLTAFFTPGAGAATITSAILTAGTGVGKQTWTFGLGGVNDKITVSQGGGNDRVRAFIASNGVTSTSGGLSFGGLNLLLNAPGTTGNVNSSAWQTIYNSARHGQNGAAVTGFVTVDNFTYNFSGTAVPEPGSIALLSGLGLVFGAVRRRRQTRVTAV